MTAQTADILVYQGKQFSLFSNPLEEYFKLHPPRPFFVPTHTANWRGYVAEWVVTEGRLYLAALSGTICVKPSDGGGRKSAWCQVGHSGDCTVRKVTLGNVFKSEDRPIPATWVTGELRAPDGELVEYVHMGYGSRYERNLLFDVIDGMVVRTRILGDQEYEGEADAKWQEIEKRKRKWWRFWRS
jgi:hypothetical protein